MNESPASSTGPAAQTLIRVAEPADVGEAQRQAAALAIMLAFDRTSAGQLALAITEAANNVVKHAGEGRILIRALQRDNVSGVEVLVLDRGPGMGNLSECLRDGYSTAGSPGTGLGALQRLTQELDIASYPDKGTVIRFVVWSRPRCQPGERLIAVGAVCVPKAGEIACGDAWTVLLHGASCTLLIADGLGHGVEAAAAANTAVDLATRHAPAARPQELMGTLHAGMRATRGAAVAVVVLEPRVHAGMLCGIGNIGVSIHHRGASRKLVSHNGIVGHQLRKLQEFPLTFAPSSLLVAHSDGLDTRWRLEDYPGLENMHPAVIAGVLYRDHERGRDDATVVVIRNLTGIPE